MIITKNTPGRVRLYFGFYREAALCPKKVKYKIKNPLNFLFIALSYMFWRKGARGFCIICGRSEDDPFVSTIGGGIEDAILQIGSGCNDENVCPDCQKLNPLVFGLA